MNAEAPTLSISEVHVGPEAVEAVVRVASEACMRTASSVGLHHRVLAALPGIVSHRCECGSAHGIEAELADTETPHLLEHVALELMVMSGSPRTLRGDTRWDFETDGRGVFRVTLAYDDDLVALRALKDATGIVEALFAEAPEPVLEGLVAQSVARLHEMRTVHS